MRGGATFLAGAAMLISSCGGEQGKLTVRSIATPLAQGARPVSFRVAEARGQFALGNVALALESFRKAAREDPNSVDAFAGIAACYDRMGRFDLSRRNYESALAIAPGDPQLLGQLAASLDAQGRGAEALAVRREIAMRLAAAQPAVAPQAAMTAPEPPMEAQPVAIAQAIVKEGPAEAPVGRSVTVALPPPRPIAEAVPPGPPPAKAAVQAAPVQAAPQPAPTKVAAQVAVAKSLPAVPEPAASLAPPSVNAAVKTALAKPMVAGPKLPAPAAPIQVGRSVTIALPPPRPVAPLPAAPAKPKIETLVAARSGPRVERLSLGEVALITSAGPRWKAQMADRSAPRFVPLRQASAAPAVVRLLNAARVEKLAARTRSYLGNQGWRRMTIGDAAVARTRSLIVYPTGQREMAARLSSQLGMAMAERSGVRMVTILLGRDAAGMSALRAKA